ncbi:MAG: hypothetical protein H7Y13_00010 [Sphingobacteriaceae bacterium]|nr:hypothetical protein [Sphingobacteriaceae bacterium]
MGKTASKTVNIFLALDKNVLNGYFNPHDIAPIYKRQLSVKFQNYVKQCIKSCRRHDAVIFKLNSKDKIDEQFAEPLMYAIRKHYTEKKQLEIKAFAKFKQRNYGTLAISLVIVSGLNFLLPVLMDKHTASKSGMAHFIDVFSFIIFYHPLTEILFNWNPHLKRINLLNKIIKAESIVVQGEKGAAAQTEAFEDYELLEEADSLF